MGLRGSRKVSMEAVRICMTTGTTMKLSRGRLFWNSRFTFWYEEKTIMHGRLLRLGCASSGVAPVSVQIWPHMRRRYGNRNIVGFALAVYLASNSLYPSFLQGSLGARYRISPPVTPFSFSIPRGAFSSATHPEFQRKPSSESKKMSGTITPPESAETPTFCPSSDEQSVIASVTSR